MARNGIEPTASMGHDTPLAMYSRSHDKLFGFFYQRFAQVTNPPIDPIREELVMSIMTYIGNQGNILAETPEHARLVKMTRPVLTDDELKRMRHIPAFPAKTLPLFFDGGLKAALDKLAADALQAAKDGTKIVILSDRDVLAAPDAGSAKEDGLFGRCGLCGKKRIPSLLAVAAVLKALAEAGFRPSVGIVVESCVVR